MKANNYGFIPDRITRDNLVLGGKLGGVVLQPSGQWLLSVPTFEPQFKNNLETCNCTAFNTIKPVVMLIKRMFGTERNYSERYLGTLAGTWPPGNSPHKVAETLRKKGLCPDSSMPFDAPVDTLEEYYDQNIAEGLKQKGSQWLDVYGFGHDWVFLPSDSWESKKVALKEALKYSPVGVAVYAWAKDGKRYVREGGDNHWTTIIGYEEGDYWLIHDSYIDDGEPLKRLSWDFGFDYAKRYIITPKINDPIYAEDNGIKPVDNWLVQMWKAVVNFIKEVYEKR